MEDKTNRPPFMYEQHATGFANWLNNEGYQTYLEGTWYNSYDSGDIRYSTEELYKLYLESL